MNDFLKKVINTFEFGITRISFILPTFLVFLSLLIRLTANRQWRSWPKLWGVQIC